MNLGMIASLVGISATLLGGAFFIEDRYDKVIHVAAIEERLEVKIVSDQVDRYQNRAWDLEDKLAEEPSNKILKKKLRETNKDLKDSEQQLEAIRKKE